MSRYRLTDAVYMAAKHPDTFKLPRVDFTKIAPGDVVKLENGAVRSWVTVRDVRADGKFVGTPDHPSDFGGARTVHFGAHNVLDAEHTSRDGLKWAAVAAAGVAAVWYILK